jgi:hypothetical protein
VNPTEAYLSVNQQRSGVLQRGLENIGRAKKEKYASIQGIFSKIGEIKDQYQEESETKSLSEAFTGAIAAGQDPATALAAVPVNSQAGSTLKLQLGLKSQEVQESKQRREKIAQDLKIAEHNFTQSKMMDPLRMQKAQQDVDQGMLETEKGRADLAGSIQRQDFDKAEEGRRKERSAADMIGIKQRNTLGAMELEEQKAEKDFLGVFTKNGWDLYDDFDYSEMALHELSSKGYDTNKLGAAFNRHKLSREEVLRKRENDMVLRAQRQALISAKDREALTIEASGEAHADVFRVLAGQDMIQFVGADVSPAYANDLFKAAMERIQAQMQLKDWGTGPQAAYKQGAYIQAVFEAMANHPVLGAAVKQAMAALEAQSRQQVAETNASSRRNGMFDLGNMVGGQPGAQPGTGRPPVDLSEKGYSTPR